jgi:hypothetical protein
MMQKQLDANKREGRRVKLQEEKRDVKYKR